MSSIYAQMYGLNVNHKSTEGGTEMNRQFRMPATIAANQSQFHTMFYNLRKNYWENATGWALAHIVAKDLDELKLNTPNEVSDEVKDAEIELMELLAYGCEISRDHAYWVLHNMYIPDEEEYAYLMRREYGENPDETIPPHVEGVYDSIEPGMEGWFNYCKSRWDSYHDAEMNGQRTDFLRLSADDAKDEKKVGKALKAFAQTIEDDWKAMTPQEQQVWG